MGDPTAPRWPPDLARLARDVAIWLAPAPDDGRAAQGAGQRAALERTRARLYRRAVSLLAQLARHPQTRRAGPRRAWRQQLEGALWAGRAIDALLHGRSSAAAAGRSRRRGGEGGKSLTDDPPRTAPASSSRVGKKSETSKS